MVVKIRYTTGHGNTVPYPPLFDEIRRNHGFIDTRGHPERVSDIPEARQSVALAALLTRLALPSSRLISLGCDLGQHDEPKSRLETRRVAGGYVQIIAAEAENYELDFLRSVAAALENGLKTDAGQERWEVDLQLAPIVLEDRGGVETHSIWIWFYAKSSTGERAISSRERLVGVIERVLGNFEP